MRQYRLIIDPPANGKHNMAVDDAIMTTVANAESAPTLRLYAWNPPCLSLGHNQRSAEVDLERLTAYGWDIVRRPTGGRAILHTDELTYSIILPTHHTLVRGAVVESYHQISQALRVALQNLGLQPEANRHNKGGKSPAPACFEAPSDYEITTPDGRKLAGSAQVRRNGAILQHGSLPLCGDIARICDALVYSDDTIRNQTKARVRCRAATLADALDGKIVPWQTAADAVIHGFAETFGFAFARASLSPAESALVEELLATTYGNPDWTFQK